MNDLLSVLTLIIDFCAMTISLWLAFYLFGKGYPEKVAMRAVVVFFSLAVFFFGAYDSQNHPTTDWATELRAVAIVLTLTTWYSLTYQMIINSTTNNTRYYKVIVYLLGATSAILLLVIPNTFVTDQGSALDVARMRFGLPYFFYGAFLLASGGGILYNLLSGNKVGLQPQGRYFLIASV